MDKEVVVQSLNTSSSGLNTEEAKKRLEEYGYNELKEKKGRSALQMFLGEFKDIFIMLLIVATIFSVIIGYYESISTPKSFLETYSDAIIILVIVVLVAVAGFIQEYRAEKAVEALKKLTKPKSRVLRDGKEVIIPSREIVPGDLLVLEAGDTVPADARIIESIELKADEAVLTGESNPIGKGVAPIKQEAPIAERKDMLFMATHTIYGRGKAVVTSTGMSTEFGKIAELVQTAREEETPLQKKLDSFAKKIARVVLVLAVIIFILEVYAEGAGGLLRAIIDSFMASISLAISVVPEGLPAIVTIGLAMGAREFARRHAIIRRLSSAESLGAVTYICSDKTGTLTKGEMTVRRMYNSGKIIEVTGVGYEPKGEFHGSGPVNPKDDKDLSLLLTIGALCNNSSLENDKGSWRITGDPTEGALIVAAAKAGFERAELEKQYPRVGEIPFSSERKRMTTIHKVSEIEHIAFLKGAPETVLERCNRISENGKEKKLTDVKRKEILETNEKLAGDALRVLGMAYKHLPITLKEFDEKNVENDVVFVGLEGMIDPPREEAVEANKKCMDAGIKTVMITGDHKLTAMAVAKEIGIMKENSLVLTGIDLDKINDEEFEKIVENVAVYARVSPEHKLRIVIALKKKGQIVAMTGDGVNDAPAIKSADVGIAMGISGTDVTREASDMVLTDDNFATIVRAVEEGRVIYDNVRKYARFLIACNFDEVVVIGTFAILAGLGGLMGEELFPLPLLPSMLLWINLATDGLPAVALATDPPDEDVMKRYPRKPSEGILQGMGAFIIVSFLLQSIGTILLFVLNYYIFPTHPWGWPNGPINDVARELTLAEARTTAFIQATFFELFVVWNCRSEKRSVWKMGRSSLKNKFFVIAEIGSMIMTLAIPYIPITASMFHLVPLTLLDLVQVLGVASWGLFFVLPEYLMGRKIWRWK
jgi:Ca2+-transporting ATPase